VHPDGVWGDFFTFFLSLTVFLSILPNKIFQFSLASFFFTKNFNYVIAISSPEQSF